MASARAEGSESQSVIKRPPAAPPRGLPLYTFDKRLAKFAGAKPVPTTP
jgi:hypothetical protein